MDVIYEISIGPYKQIGSTCNLKRRMNVHLSYKYKWKFKEVCNA